MNTNPQLTELSRLSSNSPLTFPYLIKNFFIYLCLLPRPHRRFLFAANLVKQRGLQRQTQTLQEIFALIFIILFALGILLFTAIVVAFGLPLFGHDAYRAFDRTILWLIDLPLFLLAMSYCDTFPSRALSPDTAFFLRYSHYAQTPQFADKTKRRQVLMLERSKYVGITFDILFFLITPTLFIALFFYSFLTRGVNAYSIMLVLSSILMFASVILAIYFIFPITSKLLYSRYIAKHGPMPQEITDIVNKAWELYPDPPKRNKHPKPATAGE